jgi:nucleotide-binding universal stress UspA family protein
MFHPHRILCPTDFSENSRFALHIALDLARQNEATLLVLHVADTLGPEKLTYAEASSQLQPEAYVTDLQHQLKSFVPVVSDVPILHLLREGMPPEVIQQVAAEEACDLIVIGTHGRTGLDRLLMGSLAEETIRRSPCPVLVVKYPRSLQNE